MSHLALHAAVRHETQVQASVAEALRAATRRRAAAIELEQARQAVREAGPRLTKTLLYRQACAEAVWDALQIAAWRVTR